MVSAPICTHCTIAMAPGIAIVQTSIGKADFIGGAVVTMSPGGPGKLIDCWKCHQCGHSIDAYPTEAES